MNIIFFASKKDSLYLLVVWGTIMIIFLSIILNFSLTLFNLFLALIGLIAIGLLIWICFGTGYRIENETIKNGQLKWTVNILDINSISKRKSLLATPSLSVDRLVLHHGKYGEMLLSPKNESKFIELLLTKNPKIKVDEKTSYS